MYRGAFYVHQKSTKPNQRVFYRGELFLKITES
jgi:hypothetical protein